MRLPLIDGQGNFGSMDDDPPAAMRYTEARLAKAADALLADIEKDTVDFRPNYDESSAEPAVLPAQFPNLLVNGAGGIAVGMATNIPPHNLGEVIDACVALIDRPELGLDATVRDREGPGLPDRRHHPRPQRHPPGLHDRARQPDHARPLRGRGGPPGRMAIIVSEVPYQVNKARMVERIAEVVREKRVEGVADLRDESDRHGVRVVVEIKREADPEIVLNQLYKFTPLQTSFGVNMVALRGGRPAHAEPQGGPGRLPRLPRGGDHPAHRLRPRQGARAGARPGRPRRRGRQHRRGHRADPPGARPGDGARRAAGPSLAGGRHRGAAARCRERGGRGPAPARRGRLPPERRPGARDPGPPALAPDRPRAGEADLASSRS